MRVQDIFANVSNAGQNGCGIRTNELKSTVPLIQKLAVLFLEITIGLGKRLIVLI